VPGSQRALAAATTMYGATEDLCRSATVAEAAEHSPVRVADLDAASDARVAWLRRCAPVIMQPEMDVANGFGLRRVFFDFRPAERTCELSLVYDGEASYGYTNPLSLNRVATFFYRSFVRPPRTRLALLHSPPTHATFNLMLLRLLQPLCRPRRFASQLNPCHVALCRTSARTTAQPMSTASSLRASSSALTLPASLSRSSLSSLLGCGQSSSALTIRGSRHGHVVTRAHAAAGSPSCRTTMRGYQSRRGSAAAPPLLLQHHPAAAAAFAETRTGLWCGWRHPTT
jgi:hypothetical protein